MKVFYVLRKGILIYMRKEIKLHSFVLYPVWFLALMPNYWLILVASVFVIQSLVLIGGLKHLGFEEISGVWKRSILWNTLYGFISYLLTSGLFALTLFVTEDSAFGIWFNANISQPLVENPFSNIFSLLYALIAVAISSLFMFACNKRISFRRTQLNELGVKKVSTYLSLFTAPYLLLYPSLFFYQSISGMIPS